MNYYDEILHSIQPIQPLEHIEPITSGLSHCCFKVRSKETEFFVKILNPETLARADHSEKYLSQKVLQQQAYNLGFSPELLIADQDCRYWVFEFVDGRPISHKHDGQEKCIDYLMRALLQTQQLTVTLTPICLEKIINNLVEQVTLCVSDKQRVLTYFNEHFQSLGINDERFVVCHGDINKSNVFKVSNKCLLLDWEYAVLAEPEYDLAMLLSNLKVTHQELHKYLDIYHQTSNNTIKLDAVKVTRYFFICNLINALWYICDNDNASLDAFDKNRRHAITWLETEVLGHELPS